jgi:hypothetical protein
MEIILKNKIIDFIKCSACVWIWELPGIPAYCRLYEDVNECEGPIRKEINNEKENSK